MSHGPFGEIALHGGLEVPLALGVNLEAIRAIDEDPCFVTVKIKSGRGQQGQGYNYGPALMRTIGEQVLANRPAGYRGHQDEDKVHYEWREPVTTWIGALWNEADQSLYVKGYVHPTAPELRQQVRMAATGIDPVNSVSIWGTRRVDEDTGEVESMDLWSIDWTPKGRAGMETELVSVGGEQQDEDEEVHVTTREEVIASLTEGDLPPTLVLEIETRAKSSALEVVKSHLLGLLGEENLTLEDALRRFDELAQERRAEELRSKVDELVAASVTGEMQRDAVASFVTNRLRDELEVTDEQVAAEIESAKEVGYIKALGSGPAPVNGSGGDGANKRRATSWAT
jgi:hypothetical protein